MTLTRRQRLEEFFRRVTAAPPCADAQSALSLLTQVLTEVEDEFSGAANDPREYISDGRLYPPQADAARPVPGHHGVIRYRSVGHNTFISADGAMLILEINGECLLNKPSESGKTIPLTVQPRPSVR
jgi:hypothetical protein